MNKKSEKCVKYKKHKLNSLASKILLGTMSF